MQKKMNKAKQLHKLLVNKPKKKKKNEKKKEKKKKKKKKKKNKKTNKKSRRSMAVSHNVDSSNKNTWRAHLLK